MRKTLRKTITASFLITFRLTLRRPGKGSLARSQHRSAQSITGDVALSDEKITINLSSFTMARVRSLEKVEISALFDADSTTPSATAAYIDWNVPASKKSPAPQLASAAQRNHSGWPPTSPAAPCDSPSSQDRKSPSSPWTQSPIQPTSAAHSLTQSEPPLIRSDRRRNP